MSVLGPLRFVTHACVLVVGCTQVPIGKMVVLFDSHGVLGYCCENNVSGMQTLLVLYIVDDLTGFNVTKLVELPEPYGIIAVWGLVLPLIYVIATSITNIVLNDALILKVAM